MNVFVSGCFDIIHSGHIIFLKSAKQLGDTLTVSIAGNKSLKVHKQRTGALSPEDRRFLLQSYDFVDNVIISDSLEKGINFRDDILSSNVDILAVTEDDQFKDIKKVFCDEVGIKFVTLSKNKLPNGTSTTEIRQTVIDRKKLPLRIDFVGGWLDVPKYSLPGGFIVNCAITPFVTLEDWPYNKGAGLGGSAAYTMLQMKNGVESELDSGVGWQDPAIIEETGLCVWRSGKMPVLDCKLNPDILEGKMAIWWTEGREHDCNQFVDIERDYSHLRYISSMVKDIMQRDPLVGLTYGVNESYKVQLDEGMLELPSFERYRPKAYKYCGGGFGGYAIYLFRDRSDRDKFVNEVAETMSVEPYIKAP